MTSRLGLTHMVALAALTLGGCAQDRQAWAPTGSSATALSGGALYIADEDNGALARVMPQSGAVESLVVGVAPARVVRVGDRLLVTLSGERSLAEVRDTAQGMVLERKVVVGAEPFGIVATTDGTRVYVALQADDAVVELDGSTLEELRRFPIADGPRWLALHERGGKMFVGSRKGGRVSKVTLANGSSEEVSVPPVERGVEGNGGGLFEMTPRITGDLAISPDGDTLAIPTLYVDHFSTVGSSDESQLPTIGESTSLPVFNPGYYAQGPSLGLTRFNASLVTIPLRANGEPRENQAVAHLVVGLSDLDSTTSQDEVTEAIEQSSRSNGSVAPLFGARIDTGAFRGSSGSGPRVVRSYLSSVTFDPDGDLMYATIEGSGTVVATPLAPVTRGRPSPFGSSTSHDPFDGISAFEFSPNMMAYVGEGPRGLVIDEDGDVLTWSFIDRQVASVPSSALRDGLEAQVMGWTGSVIPSFHANKAIDLQPSALPALVQQGRRSFYSATDTSMVAEGAGVSCATCHFDGRDDGLTWNFPHGPRQTPTLAGKVSETLPLTWTDDVPTLQDEIMVTSQGRMLGKEISTAQLDAITAYVDWSPAPDKVEGLDPAAVERGRELFESAATGCATCHSGKAYTDNRMHEMYGLPAVGTPGLVRIAATAPYLHDGTAKTLMDVLATADAGGMGSTAHLNPAQLTDLVTFLRSL